LRSTWHTTAALSRALAVGGLGLVSGVLFGEPVIVMMTAPLLLFGALGLVHRPLSRPTVERRLQHRSLHEGQGTRCLLSVDDPSGVEHVTRIAARVPFVALHPAHGRLGGLLRPGGELPAIEVSPRRWGRREMGEEDVALTSRWAGYRWGPTRLNANPLEVLPVRAPFDSRAEAPHPIGLVGAHRSRRLGDGSEFAAIRPFHAGDRLRRINWRVSLRTDELHVVTARGEEDTGVLVVVDALADHGRSGGVDGAESSLDVTVRAASALAEHHVRRGDRVSLRVVGPGAEAVGYGAGQRHLRRITGRLAAMQVGDPHRLSDRQLQFGATAGTVVFVLSPMLSELVGTATATLVKRGVPVLVVDTLPPDATPSVLEGTDPVVADLAWRMRLLERERVLARLAAMGCPVVPWRGPGTLDIVLRRLSRRAQLPQVRAR
jgi:uncharacterized protein (DUF58 family)